MNDRSSAISNMDNSPLSTHMLRTLSACIAFDYLDTRGLEFVTFSLSEELRIRIDLVRSLQDVSELYHCFSQLDAARSVALLRVHDP